MRLQCISQRTAHWQAMLTGPEALGGQTSICTSQAISRLQYISQRTAHLQGFQVHLVNKGGRTLLLPMHCNR